MFTIKLYGFVCAGLISTISCSEPECSRFDYEEKLLSKVIRMEIRLEQLERELSDVSAEFSKRNSQLERTKSLTGNGATYVRWGRTVCGGNNTQLVYKGYAGGSHFEHTGAAIDYLCLPEDPEWAKYDDTKNDKAAYVFGAEYQVGDGPKELFAGQKIEGNYVENPPCAVCQPPRHSVLMIPGKLSCPAGWSREYIGYLVAGHHGHKAASEYICLDATPEVVPRGNSNDNEKLVYTVEARCGALQCPPYVDGREMTCVVCSV